VQYTICGLAERYADASMPGFTHTQPAQPLTLGFHLMAYFWMLQRDVMRISALRLQECPLGAGAVAGTSLPVSREMTAKNLGFAGPMPNALDATSDRDFIGDALHTCATLMQHLSRFSHELVFWSNPLIGFVKLDESLTTGSSIMPQKRNPDMAELIRGRAARVIGHWTGFMSMMKGLPLGYNRDQQEDKPPLFDSFRLCFDSLYLCLAMIETAEFNVKRMAEVAGDGFSTATGVAEALVMDGMPFRQAHEVTGSLVRQCEAQGIALHQLKVDDARLQAILLSATVGASIASRNGHGGPGPDAMKAQLEEAKACLMAKDLKEG
jgi:argininosuccinate lyase